MKTHARSGVQLADAPFSHIPAGMGSRGTIHLNSRSATLQQAVALNVPHGRAATRM